MPGCGEGLVVPESYKVIIITVWDLGAIEPSLSFDVVIRYKLWQYIPELLLYEIKRFAKILD